MKETIANTKEQVEAVEEEIRKLNPFTTIVNDETISIGYTLVMTMVDTKVINALTGTSSQRCYICGCYPKEMNDLSKCFETLRVKKKSRVKFSLIRLKKKKVESQFKIPENLTTSNFL